MKKLISIFATIAMVASMFTSIASAAADVTFSVAGAKASYDVSGTNKNVMVKVTITAPNGFAGFKGMVEYDTDAFDYVATTKSGDMGGLITSSAKDGVVSTVYASDVDHMPTKLEFDEELGEDVEKACTYYYQLRFTAKSEIVNGDYNFGFSFDPPNLANAAKENLTGEANEGAKITITGGKEPAPAYTPFEIKDEQDPTAPNATEKYTQGFKATVIPNSDSITGVTCTLKTDGKPDYVVNEWATFAIGKVEATFAINVLNVPAGVAVTAEWNASK